MTTMMTLVALGLAYLGQILASRKTTPERPMGEIIVGGLGNTEKNRRYLEKAVKVLHRGGALSDHELADMYEKAVQRQDWGAVEWLVEKFPYDDVPEVGGDEEGEEEDGDLGEDWECEEEQEQEDNEEDGEGEEGGEEEDREDWGGDTEETEIGQSPLEGVEMGDWSIFLNNLRTREPGWAGAKHVGQYEQHTGRLNALGIGIPKSPEEETDAISRDLAEYDTQNRKMVADWSGDVVEVAGVEVPVTRSGILGLLKMAGPTGAESWLKNKGDRERFPNTTKMFTAVNGIF